MTHAIILVDAGTGNLRSVYKALQQLGAEVTLSADPKQVGAGGKLVLPGVGAFGDFMSGLRVNGLDEAVCAAVQRGDPLLGICVGMQALFAGSEEMGWHSGLNLLPGRVVRFPVQAGLKVPHTGWNQLWHLRIAKITTGLEPGGYAYFNHSYYCQPSDPADALVETDYGLRFCSAVQHENLTGVQFHPEKSQAVGLELLRNFIYETG